MLKALIIAENPAIATSLQLRLRMLRAWKAEDVPIVPVGRPPEADRCVVEFRRLYEEIRKNLTSGWAQGPNQLCIATDMQGYGPFRINRLDPLGRNGWGSVLGMLILAFPEVHWIFVGCQCQHTNFLFHTLDASLNIERLITLLEENEYCPLFDPAGLRDRVRRVCGHNEPNGRVVLPYRLERAAAVDDEREYAFFNAYIAYRFGFRSHVVTTLKMMKQLFAGNPAEGSNLASGPAHSQNGKEHQDFRGSSSADVPTSSEVVGDRNVSVVFEDLFLNFSDDHPSGFSELEKRDQTCELLRAIPHRVIVTTGYQRGTDSVGSEANLVYLEALRAGGQWNVVLPKPVSGVFSVWTAAGLRSRIGTTSTPGFAAGFFRVSGPTALSDATGHSTPGRLLEIARSLLERADPERLAGRSACEAVHSAVLATDALELLGGKTPTTSLEALALCHELEALAECQFFGVEGHFDVRERMEELRHDIGVLADWYTPTVRAFSRLNSEAAILGRLVKVFQGENQFSEEQAVRIRERELHRLLWFRRVFGEFGYTLRWMNPAYLVAWYVELLLRSMPGFLVAIVIWIASLALMHTTRLGGSRGWETAFKSATISFFSMQPLDEVVNSIVILGILGGVLHLGVLISHLYAIVSRR